MPRTTTKKKPVEPASTEEVKVEAVKKRPRHTYIYAVGRRKRAVARVRLHKNGSGKITVNEKEAAGYFVQAALQALLTKPLEAVSKPTDFDITIKVSGGGIHGQAEACVHGIARALIVYDETLRPILKPYGFLRRDPRRKERKKPGLKRARRGPQWSKR